MSHITFTEAITVGLLQGVTELFPVSSLGHSVLIPALIGGSWAKDLNVGAPESPYLAFIVGLHVATAVALIIYFWRDWIRIIGGFLSSVRHRRVQSPDERLAWMIVLATIPVGISGLVLEHLFRTVLGKPIPAAIFLIVNGGILYAAERMRRGGHGPRRQPDYVGTNGSASLLVSPSAAPVDGALAIAERPALGEEAAADLDGDRAADRRLAGQSWWQAIVIGSAQVLALLPGISRSGVTMAAGVRSGLSHDDAARFAFLLATPVILAAGVLKIPDLTGPLGADIGGQVIVGSLASGIGAYLSVRFLTRFFQTRTLTPFAIYCVVAGVVSLTILALR